MKTTKRKKKGKKLKKSVKRKSAKKKQSSKKIRISKKNKKSHRIKNFFKRGIDSLKTIIKKEGKAGTGIPKFDKMIKGGFERRSINLIEGGSGSGKTIFALRYLIEGVKKGENVLYVSFEEKKEEVYINMKKLGFDLEKLEKSGKFIFLEYSPEKVKMMLDEGGGAIESLILKNNIKRMVIDSITSFSLLFEDELSKRQANLGLFDIIRKWDCTTLFTVQHNPSEEDNKVSSIEFEADSITLLYFTEIKGKRERFIEVLKMRGTDHSTEIYSFDIGKGGIKIGKKAGIKTKFLKDNN